jgi:hypothetical protein
LSVKASLIGTKPFEESWADFITAFPQVEFPKGKEPMALIIAKADASVAPDCVSLYESPVTIRLVKLCRELQRAAGDGAFFLSCRTAADLLGIDRTAAWKRLKVLITDGIIAVAQPGTKTKAARYRYIATEPAK